MPRKLQRFTCRKALRLEQLETRQLLTGDVAIATDDFTSATDQPVSARIVNGSRTEDFPAVGIVGGFCSGTLISPTHVLTAAHCTIGASPEDAYFDVGGAIYETSSIFIHPRYDDRDFSAGYDVSVLELQLPVDEIAPREIYRAAPVVGQQLTLVGFGQVGSSLEGISSNFGIQHVGTTEIEGVDRLHIRWVFDSHAESNTAFGDSGGPAFIEVDDELLIAGITSGGSFDPFLIGGESFDTRVDAMAVWIDSVLDGTVSSDDFLDFPGPDTDQIFLNDRGDGSIIGTLNQPGDRDVFRVQLGIATTLRVSLVDRSFEGTFDPYLEIFDGDGTLIADDDDGGFGLSSFTELDVESGTYFVSVGSFQDGKVGSYDVRVAADIVDDHAFTEVLEFDQASTAAVQGIIEVVEDLDRFELRIDQPSSVDISLSANGTLDPQLRLFDQDGRLVAANDNDSEASRDSRLMLDLEPGSYEIEASAIEANSVGSYELSVVRNVKEVPALALDASGVATVDGRLQQGVQHQFRLNMVRAGLATISLQGASAKLDTQLTLLNESGEVVAQNDDFATSIGSRLEVLLDAGEYIIVVGTFLNQQSGDYVLQASVSYEGDADADGSVGFRDFLIVSQNFTGQLELQAGKTFHQGDFNGDGDVDFEDFLRLVNNWTWAQATDQAFAT